MTKSNGFLGGYRIWSWKLEYWDQELDIKMGGWTASKPLQLSMIWIVRSGLPNFENHPGLIYHVPRLWSFSSTRFKNPDNSGLIWFRSPIKYTCTSVTLSFVPQNNLGTPSHSLDRSDAPKNWIQSIYGVLDLISKLIVFIKETWRRKRNWSGYNLRIP